MYKKNPANVPLKDEKKFTKQLGEDKKQQLRWQQTFPQTNSRLPTPPPQKKADKYN